MTISYKRALFLRAKEDPVEKCETVLVQYHHHCARGRLMTNTWVYGTVLRFYKKSPQQVFYHMLPFLLLINNVSRKIGDDDLSKSNLYTN